MNISTAATIEQWGQGGRVDTELAEKLINYLAGVALHGSVARGTVTRVAASGKLLDFYRWQTERDDFGNPELAFIRLCGGPEGALEWLERNGASLKSKLTARLQGPSVQACREETRDHGQETSQLERNPSAESRGEGPPDE